MRLVMLLVFILSANGFASGLNRIYGGSVDAQNKWPTAVALGLNSNKIFCSGVIVAKNKVLTAGHCATAYPGVFDKTGSIFIGNGSNGKWQKEIKVSKVEIDPHYSQANWINWEDFALVTLAENVPDAIRIIPALVPSEAKDLFIQAKIQVVQVGFGVRENGVHGEKYFTPNVITKVYEKEYEAGLGQGRGVCFGDSGGPSFAELPNGELRVIGIASRVPANGRVCETYGQIFGRVDAAVEWYSKLQYRYR